MVDQARHAAGSDAATETDPTRFADLLATTLRARLSSAGFPSAGGTPAEIARALRPDAVKHGMLEPWLAETLRVLAGHGLAEGEGGRFRLREDAEDGSDEPWRRWDEECVLWDSDPTIAPQQRLARAALEALPDVLRGVRKATDILFPNGAMALVESVYKNNPQADRFNAAVANLTAAVIEARLGQEPDATLRILEVGAGTGGTTASVLPRLDPFAGRIAEYAYTDLSRAFLNHGRSAFGQGRPHLKGRIFDVEKPVAGQDLEPGSYDIAIATNVLHATRDVRRALRHVKGALRANGVLIVNELTRNTLFAHLTFGLLDGWWLHREPDLRIPGSPILSEAAWRRVLAEEGFRSVVIPTARGRDVGQQVIVAESDGLIRMPARPVAVPAAKPASRPTPTRAKAPSQTRAVPASAPAPTAAIDLRHAAIEHVRQRFGTVLKIEPREIDPQEPLETYGVDSIITVQLTGNLASTFSDLGATLLFEHNSVAAVAEHLLRTRESAMRDAVGIPAETSASIPPAPDPSPVEPGPAEPRPVTRPIRLDPPRSRPASGPAPEPAQRDRRVAVIGLAGRYPGAADVDAFWRNLREGRTAIREVPAERWDWRRSAAGETGPRYGGFIDGIDLFDPLFFRISPREAERMDPQERLFLQVAHACFEDAGYLPEELAGGNGVGVFVGAMNGYYPPGSRHWSIANRVSYALNLTGPSLSVDTACSSSLTALHMAVESLASGACSCAVAGGVNLIVDPEHMTGLAEAGLLSAGDRVRAFGDGGDGFVDGEGVGAVLLKPLARAVEDGDRVYGIIRASALNHGGKTNGYTVPSPLAQGRVVERALREAGIDPRALSYVEAQGTGSKLGDPIEIAGLSRAFGAFTQDRGFCAIGSAKSNIGHCESAAGIAGLTKVLMQMRHGEIAPSLHAETLNPHIDFDASPFVVQRSLAPWTRPVLARDGSDREQPRLAGISSFGAGGANAHIVVEEYRAPARVRAPAEGPVILPLSARTPEQLRARARDLLAALDQGAVAAEELADMAFTLQLGREAHEHRLALRVASLDEARDRLGRWLGGAADLPELWAGQGRRDGTLALLGEEDLAAVAERWLARGQLGRLAEAWVHGARIDWSRMHDAPRRRLRLPTYPFARESYWLEAPSPRSAIAIAPPRQESAAPADREPEDQRGEGGTTEEILRAALVSGAGELLKLTRDRIDETEEFSHYGFDSILLGQLANRMNARFGLALTALDFLEARTFAAAAAAAAAKAGADRPERLRLGSTTESPARPVAAQDIPLTHAQRRLWILDRLETLGAAYHVPLVLNLDGKVDEAALSRAFAMLVARHPALRARIIEADQGPVQRIEPSLGAHLTLETGSALAVRERVKEIVAQPFDLARGPLTRATLIRHPGGATLVIVIHHIVSDGWSLRIILSELAALYGATATGREPDLPPLPPHAARPDVPDEVAARDVAYWRDALSDAPQETALPFDRPRGTRQSFRGDMVALTIPAEISERLRAIARKSGATLFMTVAAGLKALILRLSGQTDIVVGTATAARDHRDLEGVVGFLTNTLSLRTDLSGDPSFARILERVRANALGAYAHASLEFDKLVEELNPERSLARHPIFQIMLTLQRAAPSAVAFGPLTGWVGSADVTATPFDLMVHVLEGPSEIAANVEFATDLYDRATIERFMNCLVQLLDAATAEPDAPLSRLALVDAQERARLLSHFGAFDPSATPGPLVPEQVAANAAAMPEAVAVRFEGQAVLYGALEREAERLARRLRAAGVGRDRIVAVALERSASLAHALYAVHKAGGAYLPLDPSYPEARLTHMLEDSGAVVLLTEAGLAQRFADPARPTILVDADDEPGAETGEDAATPPAPSDLAYVIYTSGSTGKPKGVMIEHRALATFLAAMRGRIGIGPGDVLAAVTPLSFDIAGLEFWLPLASGATVAVASRETATSGEALGGFLADIGASMLQATPSSWRMLVESGWTARPGFKALCGGEALPPDLAAALSANGADAWNLYGPTETTIWSTCLKLGAGAAPGSIGSAIDQTRIHVLDDRLQLVPIGVPGELCIAGAGLARGYLGRPELTAERFPADPYGVPGERLYRTGDLARLRPDGSIDYLGRIDHQVKIRGHRIELGEIEAGLRAEPGIVEAVVVAHEATAGDHRLSAYVTADEGGFVEDLEAVGDWQAVWNDTYDAEDTDTGADDAPSFAGWNSSLTGRPIPEPEMELWLDETIDRILALAPRRLLEIGCGLGLIARRLAPSLESYHGTDVSGSAVRRLARWAGSRPDERGHLRLIEGDALSAWKAAATGAEDTIDTVVINSVAQYFPDAAYLRQLLIELADQMPTGGRVFVGDLRAASLLPTFHAAARLSQSDPGTSAAELRAQAEQALRTEKELAVDPAFFHALQAEHPRLSAVRVALKRTGGDNELTRYRYDVTLEIARPPRAPDAVAEGPADAGPEDIAARLVGERPPALVLRGLANRRLASDVRAAAEIAGGPDDATASSLRIALGEAGATGTDPAVWMSLGEKLGYRVATAFSADAADGRFDVAFVDPERADLSAIPLGRPERPGDAAAHANRPDAARLQRRFAARLRARLDATLPAYMVPSEIVLLERLPLTPNGKIDRKALAARGAGLRESAEPASPPSGPVEIALAAIWRDVLSVVRIDRHANFFHLGGHSLLVMRLIGRVRDTLRVDLPMRAIFEHPTLAGCALEIARAGRSRSEEDASPAQASDSALISLQHGTSDPLFLFHTIGGGLDVYDDLVRALGPDQTVIGLGGLQQGPLGGASVEEMADAYSAEILRFQPRGEVRLAGWSFGGMVAFETARRIAARGRVVGTLGLIDACLLRPDHPAAQATEPVLWNAFRHVMRGASEVEPGPGDRIGDFAALARDLSRPEGPGYRATDLSALYGPFCRNFRAWVRYRPHPSPVSALVLAASEPASDDVASGRLVVDWKRLALGGAPTMAIAGDHFSILKARGAGELALHLRTGLGVWQNAG